MARLSRKGKKGIVYFILGLLILFFTTIAFSPFGQKDGVEGPQLVHSITIKAPVKAVFNYLGDSENARDWSVFVDHINTINAEEVPDGEVGSERRCFVNEDESEVIWDERITEVIPNRKRRLDIFNMQGFSMQAENLVTEQLYTSLDSNTTVLSFTLQFKKGKSSFLDRLKTYLGGYQIKSIFKENMNNIKSFVEKGTKRKP